MKNKFNLITILMILCSIAFSCKTVDKIESLSAGCKTSNGKKIGVGIKGKVFVLDATDGKTIKDLEVVKKEGAIVCSPENEVFVVYSDEIVNIETGNKYPRRIAGSTIIGINSKGSLVGHQGIKTRKKKGEELELFVEKPFDQSDDLKPFNLSLEKLGAVKRNKLSFVTKPVRLLDGNELLVFAGGKARELPAGEQDEFDPDIWGFYKVNLKSGEITPTKIIDKAEDKANLFNSPHIDSTSNGKVIAAAFSFTDGKIVFVYNTKTGGEIFRNELFRNGENSGSTRDQIKKIKSIALSKDGNKLAIAGEWDVSEGRVYKTEAAITIYDLDSGKQIAEHKFEEEIIDIIEFDDAELFVVLDNGSVAKINTNDGKNVWIKQLIKQR